MTRQFFVLTSIIVCLFVQTGAPCQTTGRFPISADDIRATAADAPIKALNVDPGAIVVTARRRSEDISKIPVSMSAFSGETLERKSVLTVLDLTKITPGLNISASASLANPFITIRGQSRGLAGPGTPGVLSYFNEVPLPATGSLIPSFDMDNIQVLKGPQGTLFGRNAIGGAVLTYSKKPTYDFGGYAEGEYGRFNEIRLEGAINIPIIPQILAVRIAAQQFSTDGYTKTIAYTPFSLTGPFTAAPGKRIIGNRQYDELDNKALRVSILFDPSRSIRNIIVVDYFKTKGAANIVFAGLFPGSTPVYALPPAVLNSIGLGTLLNPTFHCGTSPSCDINQAIAFANSHGKRVAYTDEYPQSEVSLLGVSNTTTLDLGKSVVVKNIFGYRTVNSQQSGDVDGTAMSIIDTHQVVRLQQLSEELQLSGQLLRDHLKYVVGGFYFDSSPNGLGGFQGLTDDVFNGLSDTTLANYLKERSKAIYGQIDYDLSQFLRGLGVTAGYRYTWDRDFGCGYSADYSLPNGGTPPIPGSLGFLPTQSQCETENFTPDPAASPGSTLAQNFSVKSKKGTYTFAVNWQVTPSLLLYATTRRGYRAGGFNVPRFTPSISDLQNFKPETLTDVEVGTKGRFRLGGTSGTFSLAAYRGKDKGYQYYQGTTGVPLLPAAGLIFNKANLTIEGFEAEGTLSPVRGLVFDANVAYTHIKIDSLTIPASILDAYQASGLQSSLASTVIPFQPKWQTNASFDYQLRKVVLGGRLSVNADFHFQSSYRAGDISIAGYKTVDARVTLANAFEKAVDLSLFVKNLLDETYASGPGASSIGAGIISYVEAPPRTFGGSLRYHF